MKITTVFFDLDGTLLPMDPKSFSERYMTALADTMSAYGYEKEKLLHALNSGIVGMLKNDGHETNEEVFWNCFCAICGDKAREDLPKFNQFYRDVFPTLRDTCGYEERAAKTIQMIKNTGRQVVLATNPIFPVSAVRERLRWAGISPDSFALYTTYENYHFCKPNPNYFLEILEKIGCSPEECLMVGNDATEDMAAREVGMKVFLLTDYMLNIYQKDISSYPQGGYDELWDFLKQSDII